MKTKFKFAKRMCKLMMCLAAVVLCLATLTAKSHAADVTTVRLSSNGPSQFIMRGLTDSPRECVWSRKINAHPDKISYTVNKKYVFIMQNNRFLRLNAQTGKVLVNKKLDKTCKYSNEIIADNASHSYAAIDGTMYKLSKDGEIMWKRTLTQKKSESIRCIHFQDGALYICMKTKIAILNRKTGKILGYTTP